MPNNHPQNLKGSRPDEMGAGAVAATKVLPSLQTRPRVRLLCGFIGVLLGAMLYHVADYRVLYFLSPDGRHLTFSQPRLTQSLAEIAMPFPEAPYKKVLIFGGSGAYHAISPDYVQSQLTDVGLKVDVGLVSFSSQSFVDLFAMIDALPERENVEDVVVLAWSFWRFDGSLLFDITGHFAFNRSFFRARAFEERLNDGSLDDMIGALTPYDGWRELSEAESLPKRGRVSNWTSYFLLDKIQKVSGGRSAYLFKDPPAFLAESDLSESSITRYNDILHSIGHTDRLNGQIDALDASGTQGFAIQDPQDLGPVVNRIFEHLAERLEDKGYAFVLYELPVYETRLRQSPFVGYADTVRTIVADGDWPFPVITFQPSRFSATVNGMSIDADPYAWNDYIHVSQVGARAVSDDFAASIEPYISSERR